VRVTGGRAAEALLWPSCGVCLYSNVMHGAVYDMRLAALVRMMGFPITGRERWPRFDGREKFMVASLARRRRRAHSAQHRHPGQPGRSVNQHKWHFPVIVHAQPEHAGHRPGPALGRLFKKALRGKVREILRTYSQAALAQAIPARAGIQRPASSAATACASCLWPRSITAACHEIPRSCPMPAKGWRTPSRYQRPQLFVGLVEPELAARISDVALLLSRRWAAAAMAGLIFVSMSTTCPAFWK